MAAVDGDLVMLDMGIEKPEEVAVAAVEGAETCTADVSQSTEDGRYKGPFESGPGRSISMPIIEKVNSRQETSLLQKRGHAARGDMRLPSFKTLGIRTLRPEHLLTPPDDADISTLDQLRSSYQAAPEPRSAPATTLLASDSNTHTTSPRNSEPSMPDQGPNDQMATPIAESQQGTAAAPSDGATNDPLLARHPSSSSEEDVPRGLSWLDEAVDAVVTNVPTNEGTLRALSQSQPCPISPAAGATASEVDPVTTAFTPILQALQGNLIGCEYVDLTHVVPHQFNMALLPSSPMSTPNPNPTSGQSDYFSMSVFPRAVKTLHHGEALNTPVPSSPHPLVPPRSIGVTLLERYIPPSTAQEFLDLFSTETPSVLVDRLDELSPKGGSLVFVYPTYDGANAFASKYLGPLLDPLLRTMVGIHGLTTDLSRDIGQLSAVNSMSSFKTMERKIAFLLPRLGRAVSTASPSKYSLVHSSKQVVNVERATWTQWWLQQETPRIKEVVRRYYQRGARLPQQRHITEGALAREVIDGVQGRSYEAYDMPRDGIEVGVFVIKRTA